MRLRVLIVEDSADDAKLMVRALTKYGFEVTWQSVCTAEAMQAALEGDSWDAILADHYMPEFSSLAALQLLKQSGLDLPFIVVSGVIGEDVAIEAMKAGAHDYITKENLRRLAPALERELREATVRRERRQADEALRLAHAELERRVEQRTAELAAANEGLRAANEQLQVQSESLATQANELRESQARSSLLFDKAPIPAALSRQPDGVLVDVNEAFVRAFGYTKQEALGKTTLDLNINADAEGRDWCKRTRAEFG